MIKNQVHYQYHCNIFFPPHHLYKKFDIVHNCMKNSRVWSIHILRNSILSQLEYHSKYHCFLLFSQLHRNIGFLAPLEKIIEQYIYLTYLHVF